MIESIRLLQFRSYVDATFQCNDRVNIIAGPNASGKTNLLEAILVLSVGKSYRAKDVELILFDKPWARIEAVVMNGNRELTLQRRDNDTVEKVLKINNEPYRRIPQAKKLPVVLFEPNHLQLFQLGPDGRRDYLDELLEHLYPAFSTYRAQYRRTLAQRNRLLKHQTTDIKKQLFVWNVRLSELGGQIVRYRQELIQTVNQHITDLYRDLSGTKATVEAKYSNVLPIEQYSSALLHKLEATIDTDVQRGFTSHGPHRDDLEVWIDNHNIQDVASRGEVRTIVLALKSIELQLLEALYGHKPILLLDDVFSELDTARRRFLTETITGHQVFITTTDADIAAKHFKRGNCSVIATRG